MNILVYPMFSVDVINADSNYIIIKNIINNTKHNYVLILDKNRKYYKDDLDMSRTKIVWADMELSKRRQVVNLNTKLIYKILNQYPIELIWNNTVEQGSNLKNMFVPIDQRWRVAVLNYHHYNIHPSFGQSIYDGMKNVLYQQLIGSLDVDLNYFHSIHSYEMWLEEMDKLIRADVVDEVKAHVELGGHVDETKFTGQKKYDKYTFIYNHRLAGYKNWKDTFAQFDKLWKKRQDFQVIVTGGDQANISAVQKKPYVQVKSFKSHDLYLRELQKCHANVINSVHETYCIAIAESMQDNQLIIAPRAVTFVELLGERYPYMFDNEDQQLNIMELAIDEQKSYIHPTDVTTQKQVKLMDKMFTILATYPDALKNMKNKEKRNKLESLTKVMTWREAVNEVMKLGYATQAFPPPKIYKLYKELGYEYNMKTGTMQRRSS